MIALVTGASSGIGKDIAMELAKKGYDIIAVARNEDKLIELKTYIESNFSDRRVFVKICDLSVADNCIKLHDDIFNDFGTIDVLINNAGFGTCGRFTDTSLDKEINMIDTNIKALHILMKLFLQDMCKSNYGYIMNVASIAGFMPGPLMATYYSSKAYVVRLTESVREELFMEGSKVKVSALCPGPVKTNFNKVANVKFSVPGQNSSFVAKYAVFKMFLNRTLIFPSFFIWIYRLICKILPDKISAFINYFMQRRKIVR